MIRVIFRLIGQGLRDFTLHPLVQTFTLSAVVLVAFLSGLFLMALVTMNQQLGSARGETAVQVYWKKDTVSESVLEQCENIRHMPYFLSLKVYDPKEALQELGSRLGKEKRNNTDNKLTFLVKNNPLPHTALIVFEAHGQDFADWLSQTVHFLENLSGVDKVVVTPLRDDFGQAWEKISHFIMWPSISFLCMVLGLVVGSAIRLSLWHKSSEIEILHLVGAKPWYIRLPLLVNGTFLGMFGGLLALLLLKIMHSQIYDVLNFPPMFFTISFLPWELCLALILVPSLTGFVASWIAVRR